MSLLISHSLIRLLLFEKNLDIISTLYRSTYLLKIKTKKLKIKTDINKVKIKSDRTNVYNKLVSIDSVFSITLWFGNCSGLGILLLFLFYENTRDI